MGDLNDHSIITGGHFSEILHSKQEEVPARRETFEAQILVMTRPYTKTVHPYTLSLAMPFDQTQRVLSGGKYRLELVMPSNANGKPTLIIYEED